MQELNFEELDQVGGAGVVTVVRDSAIGWAVSKLLDAAAGWGSGASSGGADMTTWTNIGNSQMGA
jgi:hypothetical protein